MKNFRIFSVTTGLIVALSLTGATAYAAKCLYIDSYHQGYAWSDGIVKGLLPELENKCEVQQFHMDTKNNTSEEFKKEAALQAKAIIESFGPDVVIVSDDNAVKYLVQPHYKDNALPFVFCGVNWSADSYGLPYKNVTGMVEVSTITAQINVAKKVVPNMKKVFYLDADNLTAQKTVKYYQELFEEKGYEFSSNLVDTFEEWKKTFLEAQQYDVVIVANNSGIKSWNNEEAATFALENSKKFSMTEYDWMMPYTLVGLTKVPEEQGMWAGKTAVNILQGKDPAKINIVTNQKSNIFVNKSLQNKLNIDLPSSIVKNATIIE